MSILRCPKKPLGFGLMEIMVVIAIIMILAALVMMNTKQYMISARKNDTLSILSQIEQAKAASCLNNALGSSDVPSTTNVGLYFNNTNFPNSSMFPNTTGVFNIGTCLTVPATYVFENITCKATNPNGVGGCTP